MNKVILFCIIFCAVRPISAVSMCQQLIERGVEVLPTHTKQPQFEMKKTGTDTLTLFFPGDYGFRPSDIDIGSGVLRIDLPFTPIDAMRNTLTEGIVLPKPLKTRGEAHITLLRPDETVQLRAKIHIDELISVIRAALSEFTPIKARGVGAATLKTGHEVEYSFYVAVEPTTPKAIRQMVVNFLRHRQIFDLASSLEAADYAPHITIGFTNEDIHPRPNSPNISADKTQISDQLLLNPQ